MKKQFQSQLQSIDPVYAIGGAIALVLMVLNGGDALRKMQVDRAATSQIVEANLQVERQAKLDSASVERQNAIAVERYNSGCQMIFTSDRTSFVALQEGHSVTDPVSGYSLPDRMVVCDGLGNTAVIINGKVDSMAFATDRAVVAESMRRYVTPESIPQHNNPTQ